MSYEKVSELAHVLKRGRPDADSLSVAEMALQLYLRGCRLHREYLAYCQTNGAHYTQHTSSMEEDIRALLLQFKVKEVEFNHDPRGYPVQFKPVFGAGNMSPHRPDWYGFGSV